jgi:hypothetical protein
MNKILILFALLNLGLNVFSQNTPLVKTQNIENDLWTISSNLKSASTDVLQRDFNPSKFELYQLNLSLLKEKLRNAPQRGDSFSESNVIISFPNNEGMLDDFQIFEASVMEPELQEKYPEIRSYIGKGIYNPGDIVRFSITPLGVNCTLLSDNEASVLIAPYTKDGLSYIVYSEKDLPVLGTSLENDILNIDTRTNSNIMKSSEFRGVNDGKLRTFRLALATTAEYSNSILTTQGILNDAPIDVKRATILANLNILMTRVNVIYERDICLTMKLVANNTSLIFFNTNTDGYTDNEVSKLCGENQIICDQIIGNENYDIGHVLGLNTRDYAGMAGQGVVCISYTKAVGASGGGGTIDNYANAMIHEMGHQFGAGHTFNSCFFPNSINSAVEPGCGKTFMAYGGYEYEFFHSISIDQIWDHITNPNNQCATFVETMNLVPTVNAGIDLTIPKSTPFVLEGLATDSGSLTYSWEQIDNEETLYPPVSEATEGPVFICKPLSLSPIRYFPEMNTILSGSIISDSEAIPSVSRVLNFNFVVRDNDLRGGQIAIDKRIITIDGNSGPFVITSHEISEIWDAGTTKRIIWDVAGTNTGAVNEKFVDILFSSNGGYTYPTKLASNVPNDGSHDIIVPFGIKTTAGRYMVKAAENIFFAVNRANLTIEESPFLMNFIKDSIDICSPSSLVTYNFIYNTYQGYSGMTTFSSNIPTGTSITFDPASANTDSTIVKMTVNGINTANIGKNSITVTGISSGSPNISKTKNVILNVYSSIINPVTLISPINGTSNVPPPYKLSWNANINAKEYIIEISTDNEFLNIVETETSTSNEYIPSSLIFNTQYFWRIKAKNPCSNEVYSVVNNFKSIDQSMFTYIPDDNFQQALIELGYDNGIIDNYILTSNIKNVKSLNIGSKEISDLTGIQDFSELTELFIDNNKLTSLDISKNIALTKLMVTGNQISYLDVSKNIALNFLVVQQSNLKELDITKNIYLKELHIPYNQIEQVDISSNANLETFNCYDNNLKSLDVSKNFKLTHLMCPHNNLPSLDLSKNKELQYVDLMYNALSYLNIKNSNNGKLNEFYVTGNPNLTCIQVDNVLSASNYSGWYKDNTALYSEDCTTTMTVLPLDISSTKFLKVYPNPVTRELIIEVEGNNEKLNFVILNVNGQVVFKGNFVKKTTVPTNNFAPGIYLIKLENGNTFEFKKVIKV